MNVGTFTKPKRSKRNKKIKFIDPFFTGKTADRNNEKFDEKPDDKVLGFSNKMKEFMDRKSQALQKKSTTKKHKADPENMEGVQFKQRKREKEKDFMRRVDYETQLFIQKTKLEDKFKLNTQKDDELFGTGKSKKMNKKKKHLLSKKQKQSEEKTLKLGDKFDDFEFLKDEVKFGEVAMAPPKLNFHKLKRAPEKRLTSLLLDKEFPDFVKKDNPCLSLPLLEEERNRAINLYRQMKANKKTADSQL